MEQNKWKYGGYKFLIKIRFTIQKYQLYKLFICELFADGTIQGYLMIDNSQLCIQLILRISNMYAAGLN